jgi:hypothetical protein
MEVFLHPAEDGTIMAVSPNNGAFLLNLTVPIVNFYIIICNTNEDYLSIFK